MKAVFKTLSGVKIYSRLEINTRYCTITILNEGYKFGNNQDTIKHSIDKFQFRDRYKEPVFNTLKNGEVYSDILIIPLDTIIQSANQYQKHAEI